MTTLRKEILKLIDSDITGYKVYKETGLSQTIISDLRNGKRNIDNISLKNAEILADFARNNLK